MCLYSSLAFMHGPVTCFSVHRRKDNIFAWSQKYYLALGDRSAVRFEKILLMTTVKLELECKLEH